VTPRAWGHLAERHAELEAPLDAFSSLVHAPGVFDIEPGPPARGHADDAPSLETTPRPHGNGVQQHLRRRRTHGCAERASLLTPSVSGRGSAIELARYPLARFPAARDRRFKRGEATRSEVGTEVGTPRAFPTPTAHLTHGTMRFSRRHAAGDGRTWDRTRDLPRVK
jgi:hypothetical protein